MNILITYFSQTNNTAQVAQAIYEEASTLGHQVDLEKITKITVNDLNAYDIVFVGSACHDTDLAKPAKQLLEQIGDSPPFKLAGFCTHATRMPQEDERAHELYETWAGNCIRTFERASAEKRIVFLGYFHCQGAPSPPIEAFIHNTIVTDDDEWAAYIAQVRKHPDESNLRKAKEFVQEVLSKY